MNNPALGPISPFFIVKDALAAANYYVDALGFQLRALQPEDSPFFAIVGRDGVQIFLKAISDNVQAQPNPTRHKWAAWDAFVFTNSQAQLLEEFESSGATMLSGLQAREDGLTGFEVRDLDGYVLFFGSPD